MAEHFVVRADINTIGGGVGLSQFYFANGTTSTPSVANANAAGAAVRALWFTFAGQMPDNTTMQVNSQVESFDTPTGALTGEVTMSTVPAVVTGTNSTGYAAGVGARIVWSTGIIVDGRRMRGSVFIVPLFGMFGANGAPTSAYRATTQTSINTYLAALTTASLTGLVYAPKLPQRGKKNDIPPRDGVGYAITGGAMGTSAAVLRTRRF